MATQVQSRRGTTAEHSTFTGANGELTVDTTKKTVVVHDGATAGGTPLAKESALSNYVATSAIGTTVQAYDANTAKTNAVQTFTSAQTFTGGISDSSGSLRILPQSAKTSAYTLASADTGKHISITTGGITVPSGVFGIGEIVTIYNNSGSNQTVTQGASVTLRQAGTSNTGNRTLAQYGVATVLCVASNTFVISGSGLS